MAQRDWGFSANVRSRGLQALGEAGARYKYLFLNKLVLGRGAKLGCETTFSPDLNPCHLDSCLVGGDNEVGLKSPGRWRAIGGRSGHSWGSCPHSFCFPASLVRT